MEVALTPKPRQAAKQEIVRQFEHGVSVEDVRGRSSVPMHRTTIYRLLKRVQCEGWQATAAPAKETTAKLISIVTTAQIEPSDVVELAMTYIHR